MQKQKNVLWYLSVPEPSITPSSLRKRNKNLYYSPDEIPDPKTCQFCNQYYCLRCRMCNRSHCKCICQALGIRFCNICQYRPCFCDRLVRIMYTHQKFYRGHVTIRSAMQSIQVSEKRRCKTKAFIPPCLMEPRFQLHHFLSGLYGKHYDLTGGYEPLGHTGIQRPMLYWRFGHTRSIILCFQPRSPPDPPVYLDSYFYSFTRI